MKKRRKNAFFSLDDFRRWIINLINWQSPWTCLFPHANFVRNSCLLFRAAICFRNTTSTWLGHFGFFITWHIHNGWSYRLCNFIEFHIFFIRMKCTFLTAVYRSNALENDVFEAIRRFNRAYESPNTKGAFTDNTSSFFANFPQFYTWLSVWHTEKLALRRIVECFLFSPEQGFSCHRLFQILSRSNPINQLNLYVPIQTPDKNQFFFSWHMCVHTWFCVYFDNCIVRVERVSLKTI